MRLPADRAPAGTAGPDPRGRGQRRVGIVLIALLLAVLAASWWMWSNADSRRTPAEVIAAELADEPTTPVLVPEELPDGYVFRGIGRTLTGADGERNVASWVYGAPPRGPEVPVVEVCVARRDTGASVRGSCVPLGNEEVVYETGRRLRVALVSLDPSTRAEVREAWADTELTHRWEEPDWVHER